MGLKFVNQSKRGGVRPGAGAPPGNDNARKHGRYGRWAIIFRMALAYPRFLVPAVRAFLAGDRRIFYDAVRRFIGQQILAAHRRNELIAEADQVAALAQRLLADLAPRRDA